MSEVSIKLDLKVVQAAIHAKVQPAVEAILKKVDLPKLIQEQLEKKADLHGGYSWGFDMAFLRYSLAPAQASARGAKNVPTVFDTMITEAIQNAAKGYIKKAVEKEQPKIEAALKTMLKDSPNKLARVLHASLTEAIDNAWSFDISTTLTPREPERDDYRD